jgi:hypothetical protein
MAALVNTVMRIPVPQKATISWVADLLLDFQEKAVLDGVSGII